jgi:hypothetical protein
MKAKYWAAASCSAAKERRYSSLPLDGMRAIVAQIALG